jgi:hypothetical protein
MESRQPLILLTCSDTGTFPWVWSYLGAVVLPLPPVAAEGERTAAPLVRRVEALAPGRQIYLVLKGLRANLATSAAYGVSKVPIAKIVGVTRPTIYRFIKTRRVRPRAY